MPKKNNSNNSKSNAPASDASASASASTSASSKLKPATAINVRHILCTKHSKKEEALAKIRDEGMSFDAVARECSEDKARQGGSLGWKTRGSLLADFEKVAYELQPSSANKPVIGEVRTTEGYHLVMVEGRR